MNEIKRNQSIGVPKPLVDGPEKVSGKALYSGDFVPKNWMDNHFDVLRAWQKEGLLDWIGNRIVLTKKGLLVADALTAELSL